MGQLLTPCTLAMFIFKEQTSKDNVPVASSASLMLEEKGTTILLQIQLHTKGLLFPLQHSDYRRLFLKKSLTHTSGRPPQIQATPSADYCLSDSDVLPISSSTSANGQTISASDTLAVECPVPLSVPILCLTVSSSWQPDLDLPESGVFSVMQIPACNTPT